MHLARRIFIVKYKHQDFCKKYRFISRRFESSQTQPEIKEEKFDFEDLKVVERIERRKPAIPPFMKDCMVSIFNKDLLAYPEVLNKEEMEDMNNRAARLETIFSDPTKTLNDRQNALKSCSMYAAPLKLTEGGLAFNTTERIKYLETISSDVELAKTLSDHWVSLQALNIGLKPEHMQKLIPDLSLGDRTISLCTKEKTSIRITQSDFRTTAELDSQSIWRIKGEKICLNGSGYFLVLCKIEGDRLCTFLVHPNAEGTSYNKPYVTFDNTPGTPLEGTTDSALSNVMSKSRLDTAVISYSILKNMIMKISKYVRNKFVNGKPLANIPTIRNKVGESLLTLYVAESMAYFTAGLLDEYENPDADLEIAMCRCYTAYAGLQEVLKLLNVPGVEGVEREWNEYLNNYRELMVKDEIIDAVNMFIALTSVFHAGKNLATEVKQMRNPLFHPGFILKKVLQDRHQEKDDPKLTLHLEEHLHPTLQIQAKMLEYAVLRMKFACETLLTRHGVDIVSKLTELERLALAGTEVLAMTSVLARASRAYCIGLRNAEIEMKLAQFFVIQSRERVRQLILDIDRGEYTNLDHYRNEFGRKVLDTGTILVEKPTERVFW
ncbi:Acyl-CoA dehydrogenase family member 9, mitochondrial [Eumeta japonica]|uniref:Acyl-CoA dehydrogenase family member 9, mitochondrial n=1 Tax=Eumeta variegata TaxID=151549 RepID=A0A4C1Y1F8_EUMVA|nr:Acyl-CoA dehydrogenase family member 9, mitochondrial [Eumeta japonica]